MHGHAPWQRNPHTPSVIHFLSLSPFPFHIYIHIYIKHSTSFTLIHIYVYRRWWHIYWLLILLLYTFNFSNSLPNVLLKYPTVYDYCYSLCYTRFYFIQIIIITYMYNYTQHDFKFFSFFPFVPMDSFLLLKFFTVNGHNFFFLIKNLIYCWLSW